MADYLARAGSAGRYPVRAMKAFRSWRSIARLAASRARSRVSSWRRSASVLRNSARSWRSRSRRGSRERCRTTASLALWFIWSRTGLNFTW